MSNNTTINMQGIEGMTLRDYLASSANDKDVASHIYNHYEKHGAEENYVPLTRAQARYIFADAMLEARRK